MKKILLFLFLSAFSFNALSQELPVTNSLSKLNKLNKNFSPENKADKNAAKVKDFSFTVNPYLWTIALSGTIGFPNIPAGYPRTYDFNKSFSDALKNLKMAFMVGGKLKYKRVSLLYDFVYINIKNFGATLPAGTGLVSANFTIKESITDLSLAYSFPTTSKSTFIDAYAGARIWTIDQEITLFPTGGGSSTMRNANKTWVDPLVGINVSFLLSNKWFSYLRSDFGGFGANSQYTFMILGGFGYRISPNFNTSLGLKNLSVNYDKDGQKVTLNQYGFIISLGYVY